MASISHAAAAAVSEAVSFPPNIVYRSFVNETVILNLTSGTYHAIAGAAGRMLEALDRRGTVSGAAAEIAAASGRPPHEIAAELRALAADLASRGLIVLGGARASGAIAPQPTRTRRA